MYAQVNSIRVPLGCMPQLRELVEEKYLPVVRARPGFLAAYLLEQVDDPDSAQLLVFWDSHAAVESFHRTGLLESSVQALAAEMPGVQVRRQGYIVPLAVRGAVGQQLVAAHIAG
jgi:heme-degrading monooxygenase HmoA